MARFLGWVLLSKYLLFMAPACATNVFLLFIHLNVLKKALSTLEDNISFIPLIDNIVSFFFYEMPT